MANLGAMRSRVQLIIAAHLLSTDVDALINRVTEAEMQNYPWHRLRKAAVVNSIAPKADGTIAAVEGSTTIVGTGTTFAGTDVGKVIRLGTDDALYVVESVSNATEIVLTTPYPLPSLAGIGYELFPLVYPLPYAGAQRITAIRLTTTLREFTRDELNVLDPARRSTANPSTGWAPYGRSASDNLLFELWPHPSSARAYTAEFLIGFTTMVNDSDEPLVSSTVIENKCLWDCSLAIYGLNGDPRWAQMAQTFQGYYENERQRAVEEDSKQYGLPLQVLDAQGAYAPGLDYIVNHDL